MQFMRDGVIVIMYVGIGGGGDDGGGVSGDGGYMIVRRKVKI